MKAPAGNSGELNEKKDVPQNKMEKPTDVLTSGADAEQGLSG